MSYWRRGREYVDEDEYLDERIQYKLDAAREEIAERKRLEEEEEREEKGGDSDEEEIYIYRQVPGIRNSIS